MAPLHVLQQKLGTTVKIDVRERLRADWIYCADPKASTVSSPVNAGDPRPTFQRKGPRGTALDRKRLNLGGDPAAAPFGQGKSFGNAHILLTLDAKL